MTRNLESVLSPIFAAALLFFASAFFVPALGQDSAPVPAASSEYRLGPGDKVRLIVFNEDNLGGEFTVSGAGVISLPLIGEIQADGLTANELQSSIANAFKQGYLNDPKVNIEILNFRPFYILGEVNKPGEFPYSSGMTVVKAVALAQGYTYRANQKKVYIRRANSQNEVLVPLTSSLEVEPGDTIRIVERYF